jgi:hypothetical protein
MRHLRLAHSIALAISVLSPLAASAGLGDPQTITGQVTAWGPNRFGQQLAVVQDDEGRSWIVRFDPGTLPNGAAVGTEMTIVGRESAMPGELDVVTASLSGSAYSALPAGAASGWAVIPGSVQDAAGTTAVLKSHGGTVVTVDTSALNADARTWLTPGAGVTIVGVYRADGVLAAQGVATAAP